MTNKIELGNITSGYNLTKVNENFQKIEDELNNKVLYRDNPDGEDNQLKSDVDANNRRIFNLPEAITSGEPVRKAEWDQSVGLAEQYRDEAEEYTKEAESWATIAANSSREGSAVRVDSVKDLNTIVIAEEGQQFLVTGYQEGSTKGGGPFVWATNQRHDGVNVIDPDRIFPTNINDKTQADAWFEDSGINTSCFVRLEQESLPLINAGVITGDNETNVIFNSAAFNKCLSLSSSTRKPLIPPLGETVVINKFRISEPNISIEGLIPERRYNIKSKTRTAIKIASGNLFGVIIDAEGQSSTLGGFTLDCRNTKYSVIDTALDTYMHDMVTEYGDYGPIQAANGNNNLHERVTYFDHRLCNGAVLSPSTWSWTLPDLVSSGDLVFDVNKHYRTTVVNRKDITNRLGGFGWIISQGESINITGTTESTKWAPLVVLNQDSQPSLLNGVYYEPDWTENGWDGFVSGTTDPTQSEWDVSECTLLHQSAGTLWSEWTPQTHVGFGFIVGSTNSVKVGTVKLSGRTETQSAKTLKASKCGSILIENLRVTGFGGQGTGYDIAQDVSVQVRNSGGVTLSTGSLANLSALSFAEEGGTAEVSGGIYSANGLGLTVNPNVLKDYSSHPTYQNIINAISVYTTFTPVLKDGSGNIIPTNSALGRITRIGDHCVFFIQLNITDLTGFSGRIGISGIPQLYGQTFLYGSANHSRFPYSTISTDNISVNVNGDGTIGFKKGVGLDAADVIAEDCTLGLIILGGNSWY